MPAILRGVAASRTVRTGLALRVVLALIFVAFGRLADGGAQSTPLLRATFVSAALAFDMAALAALAVLISAEHRRNLLLAYWFCPATLFFFYVEGRLEGAAVALLLWSLVLLLRMRFAWAGALLGAAIGAATGLAVAAPLFVIYLVGRARLRRWAPRVLATAALVAAAAFAGVLASPYRERVLAPSELSPLFDLAVATPAGLHVFAFPIAYVALLTAAWRIRLLDFELLVGLVALTLVAMALLAPASAAWAIWVLPFLALHAARADPTGMPLFGVFSVMLVALHLLLRTGWTASPRLLEGGESLALTLVFALAAALGLQLFRRSVLRSSFRQTLKRPIVLGVSGDSGTGKDTLVESFVKIVGPRALAHVSGDDYHAWDRNKPMWRALTHLNPKANDLDRFQRNVATLVDRRWIRAPHYDHATGRMTKPTRTGAAEFIAVSGLHALWSPSLNALYDVRVFLDMDEGLRRRLKINRDVHQRGHAPAKVMRSIALRFEDSRRFIHPQAAAADLILRIEPRLPLPEEDGGSATLIPPLRLVMRARPGQDFDNLSRVLTAFCAMRVLESAHESGWTEVAIEGEPSAGDIAAAARALAPESMEILDVDPRWEEGLRGVMQLILLDQIDRVRLGRWFNA